MSLFTILFIADVCGKAGRQVCSHMVKPLREKYGIDYVITNVENAAGGFGITPEMSRKAFSYGIDMQTSGNHIWDRVDIVDYIGGRPKLLRPANYPMGVPGAGSWVDTVGNVKVCVINLMGRTYMKDIDCPFRAAVREINKLSDDTKIIFVDMHAEATSEKQAMLYYLDGKVSAVIGSHTHVQTADDQITKRGTAYITDAGMTGPHDSIIGMQKGPALGRFLTGMPKRFSTATDDVKLSGVLIKVDPANGSAQSIERLLIDFDLSSFKPEDITGVEKTKE
ncbi:MAG: TIGR00282 family metallophosphoesterase [candidate division Zixibacteria bacterium]|nr:TIGR00282 family metallophosphoesterase [candidate division Zixibacteria bacterium]